MERRLRKGAKPVGRRSGVRENGPAGNRSQRLQHHRVRVQAGDQRLRHGVAVQPRALQLEQRVHDGQHVRGRQGEQGQGAVLQPDIRRRSGAPVRRKVQLRLHQLDGIARIGQRKAGS